MDGLAREGRHVGITTNGRAVLLVWSADQPGVLDDVIDLAETQACLLPPAILELEAFVRSWIFDRCWSKAIESWNNGTLGEVPSYYPRLYRPEE